MSGAQAEITYLRSLLRQGVELAEQVGTDCSPDEHSAFERAWEEWKARASDASLPGVSSPSHSNALQDGQEKLR